MHKLLSENAAFVSHTAAATLEYRPILNSVTNTGLTVVHTSAVSARGEFTVDFLNTISLIEETLVLPAGVAMQSLRLQMLLFLFLLHLSLVLLHQLLLLLLQLLEHYLLLALLVCEPLGRLLLLTILLQGYLLLLLLRRHGSDTHLLSSRIRLLLLRHDNFDGYFAFIRFIARTLEFGL